jgi:predicted dehydrogenase
MIRIGIAGTGMMAEERSCKFNELAQTKVSGVYSRKLYNTKKICGLVGAVGYSDFGMMLKEVDAVVICLPNFLHSKYAIEALGAGKHVLVEYPLCTQGSDVTKLQNAASVAGTVLMVGNTIIHEAMFLYLMKHRERLGKILSASSRVAFYSEQLQGQWYMDEKYRGGLFSAFHYHHIEYYRNLLGEVDCVYAHDESVMDTTDLNRNSTTGGTLVMQHKVGGTSCIQWYLSRPGDGLPRCMWVNGVKDSVTIVSHEENKSLVIWGQGKQGEVEVLNDSWGISGSTNDFAQAILGNIDDKARLNSDIATLEIGKMADESAKEQKVLRVKT